MLKCRRDELPEPAKGPGGPDRCLVPSFGYKKEPEAGFGMAISLGRPGDWNNLGSQEYFGEE